VAKIDQLKIQQYWIIIFDKVAPIIREQNVVRPKHGTVRRKDRQVISLG
jgi:hypothetical protein